MRRPLVSVVVSVVVSVLAVAAVLAACEADAGPSTPSTAADAPAPVAGSGPTSSGPTSSAPAEPLVAPEGFERVRATVTEADGTECELCLWVADTGERRSRGLMFVTDLGGADGMAFVYPAPHSGNFWMRNTRLPLSIAFFGPDGTYLDAFDMEPCDATPCPLYPTPVDFLVAIETVRDGLPDLGVRPGSTLELTGLPCDEE